MKINNKGMTLIELLVSIVLLSTVLIFLFQLLNNLKAERENNNYASKNQVNRAEIITAIENDLNKYTLTFIEDKSNNNNLILNFGYLNGRATLETEELKEDDTIKYAVKYTNYKGEKYYWQMKEAEIDPCAYFTYYENILSNSYYFKLNIYVYNTPYHEKNNKDINNVVDDIEITFSAPKDSLIKGDNNYLTGTKEIKKNIGSCAN